MTDRAAESGLELVLDNRKLIVAFVLLISVCGCFFVVGFIEGKRQGFQQGSQAIQPAVENPPKAITDEPSRADAGSSAVPETARTINPEDQRLDWYKSVNRPEGEPEKSLQALASSSVVKSPEPPRTSTPATKLKAHVDPPPLGQVTYSVQVGAFRQKLELETKAQALRAKGFEYRIETPRLPEDLYLLKVGTFHSRAEAVAMQLRLKKSGFSCFIKTN
jgi:cell division protein FtsN